MKSHGEVGYLKILIELTEKAVSEYPVLEDQLKELKAELKQLLKSKK